MSITGEKYNVSYDALDQQVNFEGYVRTTSRVDLQTMMDYLVDLHGKQSGSMRLNFRKLRYMNALGLKVIAEFLAYARQANTLAIKLVGSRIIPWEEKSLGSLKSVWDAVEFLVHDDHFYGSQGIIEDADFIPLLRNQTRLLWPREKPILIAHGLREGMRVADICCGCGDVALLIARELKPGSIIGVDHSAPAIEHANRLQREFQVHNAEFRMGDATALMMEDEQFDFVICRLSLQIFSRPEQILKELTRILRPGGRLYLTGEDYDLIIGCPNEREIRTRVRKGGPLRSADRDGPLQRQEAVLHAPGAEDEERPGGHDRRGQYGREPSHFHGDDHQLASLLRGDHREGAADIRQGEGRAPCRL